MKACKKCSVSKPLSDFHKQASKPDGHRTVCKMCRLSDTADYYCQNRETVKQKWKEYLRKHPDQNRRYYLANTQYFQKYRKDHAAKYQQWRRDNRKHLGEYRRELRNTDPNFKVACSLRSRISGLIRKSGVRKEVRSTVLLGCSIEEFRKHIESQFVDGMNWGNYGEWHIDHVIPCSSFDLTIIDEQKKCFHYTNQRPLWAIDNLRKGNRHASNFI